MMPIITKKDDSLKTLSYSFKSNLSKLFSDSYFAESKKSAEKSQKEDSEFDSEV